MSTKRQVIDSLRNKLNERNADSNYTNQFLYQSLLEHAKWLIKREVSSGRIYSNPAFFQTMRYMEVIETSTTESCSPIRTKCTISRTKNKIPDMWLDNDGPIIRAITSVDGSTEFFRTTPGTWQNKKNDPYQKMSSMKYSFYANGYLWFPENNPAIVNVEGFFIDDLALLRDDCAECQTNECIRFLDTKFMVPGWLEGEMFSKALEQLAGVTEKLPQDLQVDKNPNRKN